MTPEWKNKFEEILERELQEDEVIHFDKIKNILKIHDNDVMLDILIIFEYHKNYCDRFSVKIEEMLSNFKPAFSQNNAIAGNESKQNEYLHNTGSLRKKFFSLNTYILIFMIFNILSMWVGYSFAYSEPMPLFAFFSIPIGYCFSLFTLIQGIVFLLVLINALAEKEKKWKKFLFLSICSFFASLLPFLDKLF